MNYKNYILLFIVVILFSNCGVKKNVDSLKFCEFNFSKSNDSISMVGSLILKRKKNVHSKDRTKTISPQIAFNIYPIYLTDSIKNIEIERLTSISCCSPKCGSTIITTKDYVFWSNPWSITSAFECDGFDYTRRYAYSILDKVKDKKYNSIDELISELPIDRVNTKHNNVSYSK